jgi:hypothetical protein
MNRTPNHKSRPTKNSLLTLAALALTCNLAQADQIATDAELQAILGGDSQIEDFEGINLAGGTSLGSPNPLNSATALASWGILPGVSYRSGDGLGFFGTFLLGNDSVVLGGSPSLTSTNRNITVTFDAPQLAIGFYVLNTTGNLSFQDTATFYRNSTVIGTLNLSMPTAGARFAGWLDAGGVTSVRVTSNQWVLLDNMSWGVNVAAVPEPGAGGLMTLGGLGLWAFLRQRAKH